MTHRLTRAEALLLCDALNGIIVDQQIAPAHILFATIADAIGVDELDAKWQTGHALLARLQAYTDDDARDLLDRVHAFWSDPNPTDDALARAGLA